MANVGVFPRRFGKYTLLAHIATGGMADVFLARQRGPGGFSRECVLKRILPHLSQDEGFVQMFLEEARIVARLSHPNIVSTFDLGQVNNDYFMALEYVDGLTLERILECEKARGETAMPWPIAVRIIASIAFDETRDPGLRAIDARHLFAPNVTLLGMRRGSVLRDYAYDFIRTFAAPLDRALVDKALASPPGTKIEI